MKSSAHDPARRQETAAVERGLETPGDWTLARASSVAAKFTDYTGVFMLALPTCSITGRRMMAQFAVVKTALAPAAQATTSSDTAERTHTAMAMGWTMPRCFGRILVRC